jgi:hypothetical protein
MFYVAIRVSCDNFSYTEFKPDKKPLGWENRALLQASRGENLRVEQLHLPRWEHWLKTTHILEGGIDYGET